MFRRPSIRYGKTPEPETPYQRAAQVWDDRIGSARVQAKNWRLMAFGCLSLALLMAGRRVAYIHSHMTSDQTISAKTHQLARRPAALDRSTRSSRGPRAPSRRSWTWRPRPHDGSGRTGRTRRSRSIRSW